MKYVKRLFAMDERELRAALALLLPGAGRDLSVVDKQTLQEELVAWLHSEGLTARHEFTLFREDDGSVWLLSKGNAASAGGGGGGGCQCCAKPQKEVSSQCPSPTCPVLSQTPSPRRPRPPTLVATSNGNAPRRPPPPLRRQHKVHDAVTPSNLASGIKLPGATDIDNNDNVQNRNIIVVQPMPTNLNKQGTAVGQQQEKSAPKECCVECGHFCVDLLSTMK